MGSTEPSVFGGGGYGESQGFIRGLVAWLIRFFWGGLRANN